MPSRISTFGQHRLLVAHMLRTQTQLFTSQIQLSTGRRAVTFEGFDRDNSAILAAEAVRARKETFLKINSELDTRLALQNLSIGAIADIAEELRQDIIKAVGQNSGIGLSINFKDKLETLIGLLNTQHQGRYIFAGTNTDVPPVNISSVADLVGLANVADAFDNNDIKQTLKVDDARTIQYGVLAEEMATPLFAALQRLLQFDNGVLPAGSGAFAPAGNFQNPLSQLQHDFLIDEFDNLLAAITQVREIETVNGVNMASLDSLVQRQIEERDFVAAFILNATEANMAEAITNLEADEVQLQASLSVVARLDRLSLLNFLR